MSETKFTPPEAQNIPEEKKKELLKRLLSPEIKKLIFGMIYTFRIDQTTAKDISQNVLFKAHKAIEEGRFEEKYAKLTSWLHKIINNECINFLRKEGAARRNGLTDTELNEGQTISNSPTAEEYLQKKERYEQLQMAINKLEPKHKEVIELYMQGYTQEEIGHKLEIPIGTVGNRTHFAKKRLSELLDTEKNK